MKSAASPSSELTHCAHSAVHRSLAGGSRVPCHAPQVQADGRVGRRDFAAGRRGAAAGASPRAHSPRPLPAPPRCMAMARAIPLRFARPQEDTGAEISSLEEEANLPIEEVIRRMRERAEAEGEYDDDDEEEEEGEFTDEDGEDGEEDGEEEDDEGSEEEEEAPKAKKAKAN
eukprot:scaffold811_cov84-Isochrysis_galbana.AAC.2